jgi:hypothetical protein
LRCVLCVLLLPTTLSLPSQKYWKPGRRTTRMHPISSTSSPGHPTGVLAASRAFVHLGSDRQTQTKPHLAPSPAFQLCIIWMPRCHPGLSRQTRCPSHLRWPSSL